MHAGRSCYLAACTCELEPGHTLSTFCNKKETAPQLIPDQLSIRWKQG